MNRAITPKSGQSGPKNTTDPGSSSGNKALTVNVPDGVLHRAKTRASLEGTTMSAVVSEALAAYADGLQGTLSKLGLDRPAK